jgi:MoaA/NifB/PqqE/SkfB family radical SAM enzyme
MPLLKIRQILQQAQDLGTIDWIYFEGGEPFLYYVLLVRGAKEAADMGFHVGLVSNGYWATNLEDAMEWLKPLAGIVQDLSISSDCYHWNEKLSQQAKDACAAAVTLDIPVGVISVARPEATDAAGVVGQLPPRESSVMYRGRAADKLAPRARKRPWTEFTECPRENLREPGRVHVDPFGNLHICQGISLGNVFDRPLCGICEMYEPESHPIAGPLLAGGPAELVRRYELPHEKSYADSCHLCYEARRTLRERFPEILQPDQMYGVLAGND